MGTSPQNEKAHYTARRGLFLPKQPPAFLLPFPGKEKGKDRKPKQYNFRPCNGILLGASDVSPIFPLFVQITMAQKKGATLPTLLLLSLNF